MHLGSKKETKTASKFEAKVFFLLLFPGRKRYPRGQVAVDVNFPRGRKDTPGNLC